MGPTARFILAILLSFVAACGGGDSTGPPVPTTVQISPGSASIGTSETLQFSATAIDQFGSPLPGFPISWSVSDPTLGSIGAGGFFNAGTRPGALDVVARAGGATGTAPVTVLDAQPPEGTVLIVQGVVREWPGFPVPGVAVAGSVVFRFTITDNDRVALLVLKVDDAVMGQFSNPTFPLDFTWETVGQPNRAFKVSAEASDAAGNTSIVESIIYVENPVSIPVNNQLIADVFVEIEGGILPAKFSPETTSGWVNGRSGRTFSLAVPEGAQVALEWESERQTTTGGTVIGESFGGIFAARDLPLPGFELRYTIDNIVGANTYFAPFITNQTNTDLGAVVNVGTGRDLLCPCLFPAGSQNLWLGYYRFLSNSNVTLHRSDLGVNGPRQVWGRNLLDPLIQPNSGRTPMIVTLVPSGTSRPAPELSHQLGVGATQPDETPLTRSIIPKGVRQSWGRVPSGIRRN